MIIHKPSLGSREHFDVYKIQTNRHPDKLNLYIDDCIFTMHWKLLYKSKYKGVEFLPQNLNTFLYIFQTMNSFKLNNQSLKYQRLAPSGCK